MGLYNIMLNEKQEKFAQSYVLNHNATEADKSAGYSTRSAYNQGYRLLQEAEVMERIEELVSGDVESFNLTDGGHAPHQEQAQALRVTKLLADFISRL